MNILRFFIPQEDPLIVRRKYNIPDTINYDIRFGPKGFVATSKELPGFVTNAKNPDELLDMINDAILEYFDVPKTESDYIFDQLNIHGYGTVTLKQEAKKKQLA